MTATTLLLLAHPAAPPPSGLTISAQAWIAPTGDLELCFDLAGAIDALRIPPLTAPEACDGLWQHTCCEAFIRERGSSAYREFNFSPSRQWAAYDFLDYRQRDPDWQPPAAPEIRVTRSATGLRLDARVPAALLPPAPAWQLGLSVVAEATTGDLSYWALAHGSERPDFHHPASFVLDLSRS